ncbi:MAG: MlaD family protein [Pseudomonadota bacterium]
METRANYIAIGLFVVLVLVGLLGALWWLYKSSDAGGSQTVRIIFPEPVTGLSTGGSVLFNGIRVGEVTNLEFSPQGGDDVIALVRVSPRAPIKTDTVAKLGFQGLTGVAYISLTGGSLQAQSLFAQAGAGDGTQVPTIRADTSAFTNVLDSAQSVLTRVDDTLNTINSFLDDNRSRFDQIVSNVTDTTTTLNEAAPQVSGLIDDIAQASRGIAEAVPSIASTAQRAEQLLTAVEPDDVRSIVSNVDQFAAGLPAIGDRVAGVVQRVDDAAGTLGDAIDAVNGVVSAIDRTEVAAIVQNLRTATGVIAERADAIGSILDNGQAIAADVRTVTQGVATRREAILSAIDGATGLIEEARAAVAAAAPAIGRFGEALGAVTPERVETIVASVERITGGIAEELPALNSFIASATEAADNFAKVAELIAARDDTINAALTDGASLLANLREASQQAPAVVASVNERLNEAGGVLRAIDPEALGNVVRNVEGFTGTLEAQREPIARLIENASSAAQQVDELASALGDSAPQIRSVIDRADATMEAAQKFAEQLPQLAEALQPGVENAAEVLKAIDPESVRGLVESASNFAGTVEAQGETIASLISSAEGAARRIDAIASALAIRTPQVGDIIDSVEATAQSAQSFAAQLPELGRTLQPGVQNASEVLAAIDADAVAKIVTDLGTVADTLASESPRVRTIITEAEGAARGANTFMSAISARAEEIDAAIENASEAIASARVFSERLPQIANSLEPGIENFSRALSAIQPELISEIVENVRGFVATVAEQAPAVDRIVGNLDSASGNAANIAARLNGELDGISRTLADAEAAITDARRFAAELPELASTLRPGVENVSVVLSSIDPVAIDEIVQNIRDLSQTLADARGDVDSLLSTAGSAARQVENVTRAVSDRLDVISGTIENVARFARSLGEAAPSVDGLVETAENALDAIRNTVNTVNAEAINDIIMDVRQVASTVGDRAAEIGQAIDNAANAARGLSEGLGTLGGDDGTLKQLLDQAKQIGTNLESASARVGAVVDRIGNLFDGPAQRLVANVSGAAQDISEVAGAFASRANTIAGGIAKFSQAGLDDLRALLNQGRSTLAAIESAVVSFDRNPSRVIFGGPDGPRYSPQRR